jgi:hypothetical protein
VFINVLPELVPNPLSLAALLAQISAPPVTGTVVNLEGISG